MCRVWDGAKQSLTHITCASHMPHAITTIMTTMDHDMTSWSSAARWQGWATGDTNHAVQLNDGHDHAMHAVPSLAASLLHVCRVCEAVCRHEVGPKWDGQYGTTSSDMTQSADDHMMQEAGHRSPAAEAKVHRKEQQQNGIKVSTISIIRGGLERRLN